MIKPASYIVALILFLSANSHAQTVGVVLSGGGASGMAHVGVLKALEENNIPIDYIVGTSAGALVGSLYAVGYSPNEIESILISKEFLLMAEGKLNENDEFYFKQFSNDASIINLKFNKHLSKQSVIPANYTFPNYLDYTLLELYGNIQGVNENFDNLFVPFRSVASDVENNKAYVFRKGNINEAVRSSMTYPFYMKPILVDGRYMYDGGIYNNFPSDILYNDFMPDVIIGCNLSDSVSGKNDDFVSQLQAVVLNRKKNDINCENGIVIRPKASLGTFDFKYSYKALIDGYNETINNMDSIKELTINRIEISDLAKKRRQFKEKNKQQFKIDSVLVSNNLNAKQSQFIQKSLLKENETITLLEFKKRYFRLINDNMISHIFPRLIKNEITNNYTISLETSLDKAFEIGFGGVFSSSPINTGFVSLQHKRLGKTSNSFHLNSYFGKLYGSVRGEYSTDLPSTSLPIRISTEAGINRYDFFKSYATFFEDVKPSYIVQNEYYSGLNIHLPINNKTRLSLKYNNFYTSYNYYQTDEFTLIDTSDLVQFFGNKYSIEVEQNTLNKKTFPINGTHFLLQGYYLKGREKSYPGSTSLIKEITSLDNEWFKLKFNYENYKLSSTNFTLGLSAEVVLSTDYNFENYFSTLLYSSQFNGINQMLAIYSPELRSNNYISLGIKPILIIKENIQIRNELYGFSPILSIRKNQINQSTQLNQLFLTQYFIGKTSLAYTSPFGPISLSVVYLQPDENPFIFQLNFGYIIHNRRILN